MVFSIIPLPTGMYRACALAGGREYLTLGFSHTEAANKLFKVLIAMGFTKICQETR